MRASALGSEPARRLGAQSRCGLDPEQKPRKPSIDCHERPRRVATSDKRALIYPQFVAGAFWNFQAACELFGAKYPL